MTKKLFRNAGLFLAFILGGIFLNSCSDLILDKTEESKTSKVATVSFGISGSISDIEARTALPNPNEHNLTKYLYLYNYTLTYVNENGEEEDVEENIICNDFSYERFINESTIRLATGKKYKFSLKAKDGENLRMEGSSIITLSEKPEQKVTIVLMPVGEEYGEKLRVDWIVPDDGVITTMKAGISPERGYAESQTEEEIRELLKKAGNTDRTEEELSDLVERFKFREYSFSVLPNPLESDNPHKDEYGATIKRIGVTYDNVKTGVARWLDYKFYDANGILVYESSESVYMLGTKTSSTVIYINPDHYYRRPVTIPVKKDGVLWAGNPDLKVKLVDKNGNEYILTPVLDELGNPTGEFEGLLPGKSSGDGSAATDGIFEIFVALDTNDTLEDDDFIKTGAEYDANTGTIKGNGGEGIGSGSTDTVELVTVPVPQKKVTLTPESGIVAVDGTTGDGSGNGGLIVPAGQNFTVKVDLDLGYKPGDDGKITIGGKKVSDGETVILNSNDLPGSITVSDVEPIEYSIVCQSKGKIIEWQGDAPTLKFSIESGELELPKEEDFAEGDKETLYKIGGWWFGTGSAEDNKDNIIHKINADKAVKEMLIQSAKDGAVVLNVYWIPADFVEYKIVYKFEDLGSDPVTYSEDETIVSFHNVAVEHNVPQEINIPQVPGFTAAEGITKITLDGKPDPENEVIVKDIHYNRNIVTLTFDGTFDGNGGNWTDGTSTDTVTRSGKYGAIPSSHVPDPVREDYRFLGWYVKGDESQTVHNHVNSQTFPAESVEYAAKWEQTHATYAIEFWYETIDSTAENPKYEIISRYPNEEHPVLKGTIGSFPAFDTTPRTGFNYNLQKRTITAGENGPDVNEVKPEGNTLVKLYFDRKNITVTLKSHGGTFTDGKGNTTEEVILEGKYGTDLPEVDKHGFRVEKPQPPVLDVHAVNDGTALDSDFTFNAWHVRTELDLEAELPATFPEDNAIYAARWTQNNGIYKVVHWAESMDKYENSDEYKLIVPKVVDGFSEQMLEGSVTKKGKIGNPMVYYNDDVTGFKTPSVEFKYSTGTITEEGNAEVVVTYRRNDYTIKFHLNAGGDEKAKWCGIDAEKGSTETVARKGKYRMDFTQPENPVREHFIFRGWVTDPDGTLEDRVDVVPSFKEDAPTDYYAVWYSKASGGLETDTSDIALVCKQTGNTITANVSIPEGAGEWTYSWSINDVPSNQIANAALSDGNKVLTLSNCLKKDYEITVAAKRDGKIYTKTEVVTVK